MLQDLQKSILKYWEDIKETPENPEQASKELAEEMQEEILKRAEKLREKNGGQTRLIAEELVMNEYLPSKGKGSAPSEIQGKIRLVSRGENTADAQKKEIKALTPKNLTPDYKSKLNEFRKKWHGKSDSEG